MSVKEKFSSSEVFLYTSARSALYALLRSLNLEPGKEVIITGFTCEVVPNAVIQAGLQPIYVDIDPNTYCMSPESVRLRLTKNTKIIIIQHTFGIPADIDELLDIAKQHNLYIIEDCAVSLGSYYKTKLTGTFGDAAIVSFELSKTITSCRGGMLLINTNKLEGITKHKTFYNTVPEQNTKYSANLLFQLGLSGILYRPVIFNMGKYFIAFLFKSGFFKQSTPDREKQAEISENYMLKLSDQQAILLDRQWKKLDMIRENSQRISSYYYANLSNLTGLMPFAIGQNQQLNLIRYPICANYRQKLYDIFQQNGIELGLWFTAPLSSPEIDHKLFGYSPGECPNAEKISNNICNLPTHLQIKKRDLNKIIKLIRNCSGLSV